MEPETDRQLPDDRATVTQRNWAIEGYWEDELMQFAAGPMPAEEANESWQEMDRPLATSDF